LLFDAVVNADVGGDRGAVVGSLVRINSSPLLLILNMLRCGLELQGGHHLKAADSGPAIQKLQNLVGTPQRKQIIHPFTPQSGGRLMNPTSAPGL